MELISIDDAASLYNMSQRTIRYRIKLSQITSCGVQIKRRMISTGAQFPVLQRTFLYDFKSLSTAIKKEVQSA